MPRSPFCIQTSSSFGIPVRGRPSGFSIHFGQTFRLPSLLLPACLSSPHPNTSFIFPVLFFLAAASPTVNIQYKEQLSSCILYYYITQMCVQVVCTYLLTPRCICKCMILYGPVLPEIKTIQFYELAQQN